MTMIRYALLAALLVGTIPDVEAQIFDRVRRAAQRTVQAAGDAARGAVLEAGMDEMGRLMLTEGTFQGTAAPWVSATGAPSAFADLPGRAYAVPGAIVVLFCESPGGLGSILLQGDPGDGSQALSLAAGTLTAALVVEGRTLPIRRGATASLTASPTESGGAEGTFVLDLGPGSVSGGAIGALVNESGPVQISGDFRAAPVESPSAASCTAE